MNIAKKFITAVAMMAVGMGSVWAQKASVLLSPDRKIKVEVFLSKKGEPCYRVTRTGRVVVDTSRLGFTFKESQPMSSGFDMTPLSHGTFDKTWTQPWGENKIVRDCHNSLTVSFKEHKAPHRVMNLEFRAFNDGIGFRYSVPKQENLGKITIMDELTEFSLTENYKTWWIYADYNTYEKLYNETPLTEASWVATPVTMRGADGLHLSFHEAALVNYADMHLKQVSPQHFKVELTPWANGDKVRTETPFATPWRTLQISPDAKGLIDSPLVLNLNEPSKATSTQWIKPMKYVGIWWGMHLGTQTWKESPTHGATTANAIAYIDFAKRHNIQGVVVEGWNAGWDRWGAKDAFDHITPAADFDFAKVAKYAKDNGIQLIGHNETGGDIPSYEKLIDRAFSLYKSYGMNAVKTGYAGGIYPQGEHHHGQFMVNHYQHVVDKALQYNIMLDVHEPIKPTGLRRTYPNLMTGEGVRGMEWEAWSEGNPPSHVPTLAFTRMLAGPLDYTPGTFDILFKNTGKRERWNDLDKGNTRVHTTLCKQLAMMVVLYSPLQMASDEIKNYEGHPAFKFVVDYNADCDESHTLNGEVGQFVTIARRAGNTWFIGSVTNEKERDLTIPLTFLKPGKKYEATIYGDGDAASWESNPTDYKIVNQVVTSKDLLKMHLASGGGQAIVFNLIK